LTRLERRFGLSSELGSGVWCSENGVFVGSVPLLQRVSGQSGPGQWHPRPVSELNRDLSECYGLPIEFTPKIGGLTAACRALNRGDLLHAQIVTIHLQIPDPPALTKGPKTRETCSIWYVNCARVVFSRRIGTRRNIRAGRPEVPAGLVENSLLAEPRQERRQLTPPRRSKARRSYPPKLQSLRHWSFQRLFHFPPKSCLRSLSLTPIRESSKIPILIVWSASGNGRRRSGNVER
jgi:hypothetical protein